MLSWIKSCIDKRCDEDIFMDLWKISDTIKEMIRKVVIDIRGVVEKLSLSSNYHCPAPITRSLPSREKPAFRSILSRRHRTGDGTNSKIFTMPEVCSVLYDLINRKDVLLVTRRVLKKFKKKKVFLVLRQKSFSSLAYARSRSTDYQLAYSIKISH